MEDPGFDSGQFKQRFLFTENVQRISNFLLGGGSAGA